MNIWGVTRSKTYFTTLQSVYCVVHEERSHDKVSCRILVPSFHSVHMERLGPWLPPSPPPPPLLPLGDHKSLPASSCGFCFLTGTWAVWHTAVLQRLCVWWVISLVWVIDMVRISCLMPRVETAFMWTSTACSKRSVVFVRSQEKISFPSAKKHLYFIGQERITWHTL